MPQIITGICGINAPAPQIVDIDEDSDPFPEHDGYAWIIQVGRQAQCVIAVETPSSYNTDGCSTLLKPAMFSANSYFNNGGTDWRHTKNNAAALYIHSAYAGFPYRIVLFKGESRTVMCNVQPTDYLALAFMAPQINKLPINCIGITGTAGGALSYTKLDFVEHLSTMMKSAYHHTSLDTTKIQLNVVIYVPAGVTVHNLDRGAWYDRAVYMSTKGSITKYYVDMLRKLWRSMIIEPNCHCRGYQVVIYQTTPDGALSENIHPAFLQVFEGLIPDRELTLLKVTGYNCDDDDVEKEEIDEIYCGV